MLKTLEAWHDRLTFASFQGAKLGLAVITLAYCWEVAARYFFNAPTSWSNEVVAYMLCISVSLALPEISRAKGHIAIDFVVSALRGRWRIEADRLLSLFSCIVCLVVAWICLRANLLQIERTEMLVRVNSIPKIWISAWLTYGFFSAGLHFLRHVMKPGQAAEAGLF